MGTGARGTFKGDNMTDQEFNEQKAALEQTKDEILRAALLDLDVKRRRQEMGYEPWKFAVSAMTAIAAVSAALVALGAYLNSHHF
jgi:hypothetical protein